MGSVFQVQEVADHSHFQNPLTKRLVSGILVYIVGA